MGRFLHVAKIYDIFSQRALFDKILISYYNIIMRHTALFSLSLFHTVRYTGVLGLMLFGLLWGTPLFAAEYRWGEHEFATRAELETYLVAYARVWRELQGDTIQTTTTTEVPSNTLATRARFSVSTREADAVETTGVRLVGHIGFGSAAVVRVWFEYGVDPGRFASSTAYETLDARGFGASRFDRMVEGLQHDTLYYYRAAGIDERGAIVRGEVRSFRTEPDPRNEDALIDVETSSASDVDEDRATLRGTVRLEGILYGYVWFEYGDTPEDLDRTTERIRVVPAQERTRTQTAPIRNLTDATTYYVRIVGMDTAGVRNYGRVYTVTTRRDIENERPKVETDSVTDVGLHDATLHSTIDMNDFRDGIAFFVYGESYDELREIPTTYTRYSRIKDQGDDLQKILLDSDLDKKTSFTYTVENLDLDTIHYGAVGLEYENERGDRVLTLGWIRSFRTKAR